ncbi:MAG: lipopolysaccharide kinase InaA family protein [Gemmataceae bacterium]
MPPSVLEPPTRAAGWVEVHPDFTDRLADATAAELLELPGEVVSGHPDRHVVRVELPGWERPLYLKRQHRVTWKERFRQWRAGFGWRSRCGREAELLKQLAAAGLPAPHWVALGEDGTGRAFLLVEELSDAVELRKAVHPDPDVLGRAVAGLHDAGFDTPDLTAKHVFVGDEVTLIDWQSARRLGHVPTVARLRALAALHASLADHLATPRERLQFLRAYRRSTGLPLAARSVERLAGAARKRRSVRDQRQPVVTAADQRLVWLAGEAVCAVPAVAATWPRPAIRAPYYGEPAGARRVVLPDGRSAELVTGTSFAPVARLRAWLRGRPWRSPGATLGRVLFHLERYGLPAPRLLAFGQRMISPASADWFALYAPPAGVPLADWLAANPTLERRELVTRQCDRLTAQLRDASCEPAGPVFWVDTDDRVTVGGVRHVRIVRS